MMISAPGKLILFGEHAVVFGEPAVALAVDLRMRCEAFRSPTYRVNGQALSPDRHAYIFSAISRYWKGEPLTVNTVSEIPSGSGLGSSAAVTVSVLGGLMSLSTGMDEPLLAERAFQVESEVQGRASPIDTSVSTHGNGVYLDTERGDDHLWSISMDTRRWHIHHLEVPELSLVVGYTGIHAPTGPLVSSVKRLVSTDPKARRWVEEIGEISREGARALRRNDQEGLGELMDRNHRLLASLGVSSPQLDALVEAVRPYSRGAKLTGAGGGGSMVALTDRVRETSVAIRKNGGRPIAVHTGVPGVRVE
ncbi:MAG: mevalonate kinase [Methanomassiliicoccales archaeon]